MEGRQVSDDRPEIGRFGIKRKYSVRGWIIVGSQALIAMEAYKAEDHVLMIVAIVAVLSMLGIIASEREYRR